MNIEMTHLQQSNVLDSILQPLLDGSTEGGLADLARLILNEAMKIERSNALRAKPYERTEARLGHANGFKDKSIPTALGKITFDIPQVRGGLSFTPTSLEVGLRSEKALKLALAEMYVQGVSTRKVTHILEKLCGLEISSIQVSRASAALDDELSKWRERPLGCFEHLLLDARYEKVRRSGQVLDCAVLVAIGISPDGKRSILGVSVALSEAEVHWRDFLGSLQARGLHGVKLIVSDDHAGLRAARVARFVAVPWQRCQFHLQQNAQAYVPKVDQRQEVAAAIRAVFDAPDRSEADRQLKIAITKYQGSAPKLALWMEENIPQGLTVFMMPACQRQRLRTSNLIERLNREIKRRTRVVSLFPNEASVLRLISALLSETSEEWETGKRYLPEASQSSSITREITP
jgi:transposase-like protein